MRLGGAMVLALGVVLPPGAGAMPLFELLGRGAEPAGGVRSVWLDPTALRDDGVEVGVVWLQTSLDIARDPRPLGYDVPDDVFDARLRTSAGTERLRLRPLPTSQLARGPEGESAARQFVVAGLTRSALDGKLSFGLVAALPLKHVQVQSPFYADEREQAFSNALHFERFGDRLDGTHVSTAVTGRPLPWLVTSAGLALQTRATSVAQVYLPDPSRPEVAQTNAGVRVETTVAPYFGVAASPLADTRSRLSLGVHLPSASQVDGRTVIRFWDDSDGPSSQAFRFRYADQPLRLTAAVDAALPGDVVAHATGRFVRWSQYRDRHDERPRGFEDVVEVDAGARVALGAHGVGVGALYSPSPMPTQSGRESRVDNDRVGASGRWDWATPTPAGRVSLGVSAGAQWLLERVHLKSPQAQSPVLDELPEAVNLRTGAPFVGDAGVQTNNPGFPGYRSDGLVLVGALSVTLQR
jgi:hypothetical protein